MKQSVLISEKLYNQLSKIVEQQNIDDTEHLIEGWPHQRQSRASEDSTRVHTVQQVIQLQQQLHTKHDQMPNK